MRRRENSPSITVVTGGFPCQPFSQAGRRKGTDDDRYLWPPMFSIIKSFHPEWVIAENVRGLATWNEGLVLETVCSDLEGEGYEVQPFIIPACAVGAPHRRDRVWIVAHTTSKRDRGSTCKERRVEERKLEPDESEGSQVRSEGEGCARFSWNEEWTEIASALCRMDDGLSRRMARLPDGSSITESKLRNESLKAYGNAIVPQVAIQILQSIKDA